MAKKKESVGVIKPKRVVKKSAEVDRLDAMQEQILNLNAVVKEACNQIVALSNWADGVAANEKAISEQYEVDRAQYQSDYERWKKNDNKVKEFWTKMDSSFITRVKYILTGRV